MGGVEYLLVDGVGSRSPPTPRGVDLPAACQDGCLYTPATAPGPLYCFRPGSLPAACLGNSPQQCRPTITCPRPRPALTTLYRNGIVFSDNVRLEFGIWC